MLGKEGHRKGVEGLKELEKDAKRAKSFLTRI